MHGSPCVVIGEEDRDAGDDWKRATLAAQHSGFDTGLSAHERVVLDDIKSGSAERASEQIEQRLVHE